MTQRIKPVEVGADGYDEYVMKLGAHHLVSIAAMKAAQSLEPSVQSELARAIQVVAKWYPASQKEAGLTPDSDNWNPVANRSTP